MTQPEQIGHLPLKRLDGIEENFSSYDGRVLLIVNTASKCGFTPQYEGLEQLHQKYKDRKFSVLGFPCNQFGHQEPGNADEIMAFCKRNYGVSFPIYAKIDVNGRDTHPLFAWLKESAASPLGKRIKWNFTKFLVSRDRKSIVRFAPAATPESIESQIEAELEK